MSSKSGDLSVGAKEIADLVGKAGQELHRAYEVHCGESRSPSETLMLPRMADALEKIAGALQDGNFATAARLYRDFSVVPHAQWLAGRRKSAGLRPASRVDVVRKAAAARANGRLRSSPRGEWVPFDLSKESLPDKGSWHVLQAVLVLNQIRREYRTMRHRSPMLQRVLNHEMSVRIEREMAAALLDPNFADVRRLLPPRWQPLTPYSQSPGALRAIRAAIIRRITRSLKPGTVFLLRLDKGRGATPTPLGLFKDPRRVRLTIETVRDAEVSFRPWAEEVWTLVDLPRYRPRSRRNAELLAAYRYGRRASRKRRQPAALLLKQVRDRHA